MLGPVAILNSPVLTGWGVYSWTPLTVEEAKELIAKHGYESAVGHEATAAFLSRLLGVEIPMRRIRVAMGGDTEGEFLHAIVLRLRERLPEGKVLSEEEMAKVEYDLGYLEWGM